MNKLIKEVEEIKRRINFELDKILNEMKELDGQVKQNSQNLESKTIESHENLVTVKRLSEIFPAFKQGGIRQLIFSNKWNFNGECVINAGTRKLLIDVKKFEQWVRKPKHREDAYAHLH